jgi:hypothetical protein
MDAETSAMSFPFDATLKDLARAAPQDFLAVFDRPPTLPVSLLNVDLSSVSTAADLVVGLGDPLAEIVQIDFQSSAAAWKHSRLLIYNSLLFGHFHVPVHSIVVLLRPQAAHSNLNGSVRYAARWDRGKMDFGYEVVRLWDQPAEDLLAGSLGIMPLAVLGRVSDDVPLELGLAGVVQRLVDRLTREGSPEQARRLLTSAYTLTGLRLPRKRARQLFLQGVHAMPVDMRDSDTYLAIMDEGREAALKELVLELGEDMLGPAPEAITTRLHGITDLNRLKRMIKHLQQSTNWQELLDTP